MFVKEIKNNLTNKGGFMSSSRVSLKVKHEKSMEIVSLILKSLPTTIGVKSSGLWINWTASEIKEKMTVILDNLVVMGHVEAFGFDVQPLNNRRVSFTTVDQGK